MIDFTDLQNKPFFFRTILGVSKVLQHAEIKNIEIYHLTRKIFQQREYEDPGNPDKAGRVKNLY